MTAVPHPPSVGGSSIHPLTDQSHNPTNFGMSNAKLGMWTLIGSECLFFGAMISTYLLYLNRTNGAQTAHEVYDIPFTSASTFILLMSSLAMVLALDNIQRNRMRGFRIWILATALLGCTFLAGQIYEFTIFVLEGWKLETSPFSSSFFMLTSFHGIHVAVGVMMLISLWGLSFGGRINPAKAEAVELVGLYWHFVDIVWIVIFTVIYLIPVG